VGDWDADDATVFITNDVLRVCVIGAFFFFRLISLPRDLFFRLPHWIGVESRGTDWMVIWTRGQNRVEGAKST